MRGFVRLTCVSFALCAAVSAGGRERLAVNEDNDHYFKLDSSRMNRASLVAYLDDIIGSGKVTDFMMCPCGMRASFDSKAWEPIWMGLNDPNYEGRTNDIFAVNAKRLFDAGVDPYEVWIARCREKGVRAWLSMRMNDFHCVTVSNHFRTTTFWRTRPDLRRTPDVDPTKGGGDWGLYVFNYAKEEVRDYHFAMFRELVDRYDADGIEMDWMRSPTLLTPGKEREEAHFLTAFMRRCREYARAAAARRGRPLQVGVRVPSTAEKALACGIDIAAWARQNSFDLLVATGFYGSNDFAIDAKAWMALLAANGSRAAFLPGSDIVEGKTADGKTRLMDEALYRTWTEAMRSRGAQGLYFFNVPYLPEPVRRYVYDGRFAE